MTVYGYTDGAARGNPGHGGIGVILKDAEGNLIASEKRYLGRVTNNVAEYSALIACFQKVSSLLAKKDGFNCSILIVHSDSELLVRQVNGVYRVKDKTLKKLLQQVKRSVDAAPFAITLKHIPRERNREADALANQGIDEQAH